MKRRDFIKNSALTGSAVLLRDVGGIKAREAVSSLNDPVPSLPSAGKTLPDLTPARWLWYPSERCLQNTFILFRRELILSAKPRLATGWITADSRYLLEVNGR